MDKAHIQDQAARMAGDVKAAVGSLADDARFRTEELASQATGTADHAYRQVRAAATAAATSVERQPFIALAAVGLACGVVGFLLARR